jgi:hypothetical protein
MKVPAGDRVSRIFAKQNKFIGTAESRHLRSNRWRSIPRTAIKGNVLIEAIFPSSGRLVGHRDISIQS